MLKRKYGDRRNWNRLIKKSYSQKYIDTSEFKGFITLLHAIEVTEPIFVHYGEKKICIVDNGYMWLQQFPIEEKYSVTTMYDSNGNLIQWYIDICYQNGIENNVPWMDDLFLDIVVLPSNEYFILDEDELVSAFLINLISESQYKLAVSQGIKVLNLIIKNRFNILKLSNSHKKLLLDDLK